MYFRFIFFHLSLHGNKGATGEDSFSSKWEMFSGRMRKVFCLSYSTDEVGKFSNTSSTPRNIFMLKKSPKNNDASTVCDVTLLLFDTPKCSCSVICGRIHVQPSFIITKIIVFTFCFRT